MKSKYPVLENNIFLKGIKKNVIAQALNISVRALNNKLCGRTSFTWEQACAIQKTFFPNMSKDELFSEVKNEKIA